MKFTQNAITIAALIVCSTIRAGEYFTLIAEKPANEVGESALLTLNAGDTAELKYASAPNTLADFRVSATIGETPFEIGAVRVASYGTSLAAFSTVPVLIAGPATIKMRLGSAAGSADRQFATWEVTRAGTAGIPAAIPAEAGTVWQVILEASTDLVNWSTVPPGDYPSASPQRFFRTRLVKRP